MGPQNRTPEGKLHEFTLSLVPATFFLLCDSLNLGYCPCKPEIFIK